MSHGANQLGLSVCPSDRWRESVWSNNRIVLVWRKIAANQTRTASNIVSTVLNQWTINTGHWLEEIRCLQYVTYCSCSMWKKLSQTLVKYFSRDHLSVFYDFLSKQWLINCFTSLDNIIAHGICCVYCGLYRVIWEDNPWSSITSKHNL